jgi:hypothetical protein
MAGTLGRATVFDAIFIAFGIGFFVVGGLYLYACDRL